MAAQNYSSVLRAATTLLLLLSACVNQQENQAAAIAPSLEAQFDALPEESGKQLLQAEQLVVDNHFHFRRQVFEKDLDAALAEKRAGKDSSAQQYLRRARRLADIFARRLNDPFLQEEYRFYSALQGVQIQQKRELDSLYLHGYQLRDAEDYHPAEEMFRRSLALCDTLADRRREVDNLMMQQVLMYKHSLNDKSLQLGRAALQKARSYGYRYRESWILYHLASAHEELGNWEQSAAYCRLAVPIAREMGDSFCYNSVIWGEGIALHRMGRYKEASAVLHEALEAAINSRDRTFESRIHNTLGNLNKKTGDYKKAEEHYLKTWQLAEQDSNHSDIALAQSNLASFYNSLGNYDEAQSIQQRAVEKYMQLQRYRDAVRAIKGVGDIRFNRGNYREALDFYAKALGIIATQEQEGMSGFDPVHAELLLSQGHVYDALQDSQQALGYYRQALDGCRMIKDPSGTADVLLSLGDLLRRNGRFGESAKYIAEAQQIADAIGHPHYQQLGNFMLGRLQRDRGQLSEAESSFAAAIRQVEDTRRLIEDDQSSNKLQIQFFASAQDFYTGMILLQLQAKSPQKAFYYSEQARARALVDMLQQGSGTHAETAAPAEYLANLQERLNANTAIVEYKVTATKLLAFVVTREFCRVQQIPLESRELDSGIETFLDALGANQYEVFEQRLRENPAVLAGATQRAAQQLYEQLISPVKPWLQDIEHLIFIPDGNLFYVPFAALQDSEGHFLVENVVPSYLPSCGLLNRPENHLPVGDRRELRLLAVSTPEMGLPFTRQEVEQVGSYFRNKTVITSIADIEEKRLLGLLADHYNVIHLACHAEIDPGNPRYSSILVGPTTGIQRTRSLDALAPLADSSDNNLMSYELYQLNLQAAELVSLSVCRSATGRYVDGEGMIGFVHPLLTAGAAAVLATLWEISDEHTPELIDAFYREWRQHKTGKATALALAQRKMINDMRQDKQMGYAHPQLWAAFTLTGEYR